MHDVYFKPQILSTEIWIEQLSGLGRSTSVTKYFERFALVRAGWQDLSSPKESSSYNQNYPARSVSSWIA